MNREWTGLAPALRGAGFRTDHPSALVDLQLIALSGPTEVILGLPTRHLAR